MESSNVLAGSVVEALLLWSIQAGYRTAAALRTRPNGAPENWELSDLINVSLALDLISKMPIQADFNEGLL